MATKEISGQPVSSYSQFEKSYALANKKAKVKIIIASGVIATIATLVLLGTLLSLGQMNGDVQAVFMDKAQTEAGE